MENREDFEMVEGIEEIETDPFIEQLKIEDIPWIRLTTSYGRADEFEKYLTDIQKKNLGVIKEAMRQIECNIEHQSTLWAVSPIATVFLVRDFKRIIFEEEPDACSRYLAEKLLSIFIVIAEACKMPEGMEHEEPLPSFQDMLKEEYLWPEEYTEEEDEIRYGEGPFQDDLFYSFYYYSFEELKKLKPLLDKIKNQKLKEKLSDGIAELKELLQENNNN